VRLPQKESIKVMQEFMTAVKQKMEHHYELTVFEKCVVSKLHGLKDLCFARNFFFSVSGTHFS
jgi:hypothetical protein